MYLSRQHTSPIQKSEFQCMLVLLASTLFSHWVVGLLLDQQLSENMIFFPLNAVNQTTEYFLFSSVQSLSRVQLFATQWLAAYQASLSITNSRSSPKLMSIESVMPPSHFILCRPLSLLPPIPSSIRVFSNESTLRMRWPKYRSFSFSIILLEWTGWISLQSKGLSRVFSNTTVQKHQFFCAQLSLQSLSHIHIWPLEKP